MNEITLSDECKAFESGHNSVLIVNGLVMLLLLLQSSED